MVRVLPRKSRELEINIEELSRMIILSLMEDMMLS